MRNLRNGPPMCQRSMVAVSGAVTHTERSLSPGVSIPVLLIGFQQTCTRTSNIIGQNQDFIAVLAKPPIAATSSSYRHRDLGHYFRVDYGCPQAEVQMRSLAESGTCHFHCISATADRTVR